MNNLKAFKWLFYLLIIGCGFYCYDVRIHNSILKSEIESLDRDEQIMQRMIKTLDHTEKA